MIKMLRLAQRWKQANNDPERMVEALAEELREDAAGKADLQALEARLEARLSAFEAGMRADFATFRNQVPAGQFAMFVALATLILYRTS